MAAYGALDRLLHRLALQVGPIAEMSFDVDQRMAGGRSRDIVGLRSRFVAGLARAGTTVLMRRFHTTGAFRSLTYRDMPFVLAPNLWRRLMRSSRREVAATERAHGDSMLVDVDSPESLDEVFWRIFAGGTTSGRRTSSRTHRIRRRPGNTSATSMRSCTRRMRAPRAICRRTTTTSSVSAPSAGPFPRPSS